MKNSTRPAIKLAAIAVSAFAGATAFAGDSVKDPALESSGHQPGQAAGQVQGQAQASRDKIEASGKQGISSIGESSSSESQVHVPVKRQITRMEPGQINIPTVEVTTTKADINRMQARDFTVLGLNSDASKRVILYRNQNGPFNSPDQLRSVPGIDMAWLDKHMNQLGVSTKSGAAAGQAGADTAG